MELKDIQLLILKKEYGYSNHVRERIEAGEFEEDDIEACLLTAHDFTKKMRDEFRQSVDGMKYVIIGKDRFGNDFYTVGKVMKDFTGRFYYYITAHQADT
jgi:hypothetical protein